MYQQQIRYVHARDQEQQSEPQAYEQQPQAQYAPAPAPAAAPAPDRYDQLAKLAELKDQGVLTTAEFEVEKAKLLGL